jgi:2'-5' RNA ligase
MATKPSNSGVIVALIPDETYTRIRPTTDDHHLTVAYLGRYNDEDLTEKALRSLWGTLSEQLNFRVACEVTGETMFWTGERDGWAHVDLIDGQLLPEVRCLTQEFLALHGIEIKSEHGFLPHITRRYIKNPDNQTLIHTRNRPKFNMAKIGIWAGDMRLERDLPK